MWEGQMGLEASADILPSPHLVLIHFDNLLHIKRFLETILIYQVSLCDVFLGKHWVFGVRIASA